MFLSESEIKRRLEHNKNIAVVPDSIKKGTLLGDNLIIKLFYFEAEATTENGIIEPRYKIGESDGGRPVAYIDDFPFQARGVVMKTGDHDNCKPYKEGDIVWMGGKVFRLPLDREWFPVASEEEIMSSTTSSFLMALRGLYERGRMKEFFEELSDTELKGFLYLIGVLMRDK